MLPDPYPIYKDAKRPTVFQDGMLFQDYVCKVLAKHHIILQNLCSKSYQFKVGENLQGFEIKLDERCTDTGRMSIEVAEKRHADVLTWTPSGIWRKDNSWLYIQGNRNFIALFAKNWLQRYHDERKPEISELPTIKKFYLKLDDVKRCAIKYFEFDGADWLQ